MDLGKGSHHAAQDCLGIMSDVISSTQRKTSVLHSIQQSSKISFSFKEEVLKENCCGDKYHLTPQNRAKTRYCILANNPSRSGGHVSPRHTTSTTYILHWWSHCICWKAHWSFSLEGVTLALKVSLDEIKS